MGVRTQGVCLGGSASRGLSTVGVSLGGLHPGVCLEVSAYRRVCIQGDLHPVRWADSPELEKWVVRILLACFLVVILCNVGIEYLLRYTDSSKGQSSDIAVICKI